MDKEDYYEQNFNVIGKFMWRIYMIEIFPDGNGIAFILNKWHPCSYIFIFIELVIFTLFGDIFEVKSEWQYNKLGLDYSKYWKENKDKLKLISRKTAKFKKKIGK